MENTDTDPGLAMTKDDYSLETYILSTNHYQIELLTNLDQAPESGALVVVSFPKPKGGSGFPARVLRFYHREVRGRNPHVVKNVLGHKLTASCGTNEYKRTDHAYRRHHAGGFSHVFVRVFSSENAGGGGDPLPNDSRSRIVYAALRQRDLWGRRLNARLNSPSRRANSTHNKAGSNPSPDLHLS